MPTFTPEQRAALSFAALVHAGAPWRDIITGRLSFTGTGWDPLSQLFGSIALGLLKIRLAPGADAALGFAALDDADAVRLRAAWLVLLTPEDGT